VPEPAGEGEEVDGPGVAQGRDLGVEGEVEGGEVGRDVALAEEVAGQGAAAVEDLVGQLAPQHEVVGDALAGDVLGQGVEGVHAGGGEAEEVGVAAGDGGEGVAVLGAGGGDRGHGVLDRCVPGQRQVGDGWGGTDPHLRLTSGPGGSWRAPAAAASAA
jgi:hypothetical protein